LWEAIDLGDCDEHENRLALAALLGSVPNDMWSMLSRKKMAREALEAVKTICVGVQRVHDSNAQQLRRKFADIEFKDGESVDEFHLASPPSLITCGPSVTMCVNRRY
jgi:uncharacterized protein (DUF924 family)